MKGIPDVRQMLLRGRELESSGKLPEAATVYQSIFDSDPSNQEAIVRMLIVFRKLKEHRKELTVINRALEAYEQHKSAMQKKWLTEHPQAAGAGKAVLRTLGGSKYSAFDADPVVARLRKRKEIVEKRMGSGNKKRKTKEPGSGDPIKKKRGTMVPKIVARTKTRAVRKKGDDEAARAKKQAAQKRKEAAAEQRRQAVQARKEAANQRKAKTKAQRAEKATAKKAALEAKAYPSFFVINLRYLAPLEQIDAEMHRHVAFLDKHYKSGRILMSGRQVPRTGGIIIAKAKDRDAVLRMMKGDPFVRKKLASIDIVEFSASRIAKGLAGYLAPSSFKP